MISFFQVISIAEGRLVIGAIKPVEQLDLDVLRHFELLSPLLENTSGKVFTWEDVL